MHLFALTLLALDLFSSPAQAASFTLTDPQLRTGLHVNGQAGQSHQPVIHLVFPDLLAGTNAYLYGGLKLQLASDWSLETLGGLALQTGGTSPIASLRLSGTVHQLFFWSDLEYSPLFNHNVYGYLTVAWMKGPVMIGVESENWVNLEPEADQALEPHWSAGPQVSLTLGQHLFLEEALLWDGNTLTPRTYFHLSW